MASRTNPNQKKSRRPRRDLNDEFRADVVRLCHSEGESISEVCKRLDLTESAVRGWLRKAKDSSSDVGDVTTLTAAEKQELQRLRSENKRLKMEREILKNAVAESLFSTLEFECRGLHHFADLDDAQRVIGNYIDAFYNTERLHSTIGYRCPIEHETTSAIGKYAA